MYDDWLTRKQIAEKIGIPASSMERQLLMAGINPTPPETRRTPGRNLTEYLYPPETVEKIIEDRAAREAAKNGHNPEAAHAEN